MGGRRYSLYAALPLAQERPQCQMRQQQHRKVRYSQIDGQNLFVEATTQELERNACLERQTVSLYE